MRSSHTKAGIAVKLKELTADRAFFPATHKAFLRRAFTRGLPLSLVGLPVYGVLRLFCKEVRSYHGVCRYYAVGKGWGGFSLGFFFVCANDSGEMTLAHEMGHCIANVSLGGFGMFFCTFRSFFRYWRMAAREKRRLANAPYESWWFERQATELGHGFIERMNNKKEQ